MGILDTFKGNKYKSELESLQQEYDVLKGLMTPEMQDAMALHQEILRLQGEVSNQQDLLGKLQDAVNQKNDEIHKLDLTLTQKKSQLVWADDETIVQEFGLYSPKFDFANALGYKEALSDIRARQKTLIKENRAVTGSTSWTVNGNATQGKKMVTDTQKLLLRAFNGECDELVSKVRYTNFDASLSRINKSASAISKLGTIMSISITPEYLRLKEDELRLAFEYQLKKQKEKEEQKAARAEQREQARIQKELEERRRKVEKEQTHYQTAYEKITAQLLAHPDDANLLSRKEEMERTLSDINRALNDIDYRQANMKAGYVYVISNIGSFGKDIYKIGMTRRLEPQDRVDELGDASVPFNFDVHAMIFSDDAPALEAALHRAFEDKKVNMVNHRREFFHVTLDEIKAVIKENFDKTVEFTDTPDAEQFRISMRMKGGSFQPSAPAVETYIPACPENSPENVPCRAEPPAHSSGSEVLLTKWGAYEMPDPYTLQLKKGPRTDLKKIQPES